jgi:hypothetical protein
MEKAYKAEKKAALAVKDPEERLVQIDTCLKLKKQIEKAHTTMMQSKALYKNDIARSKAKIAAEHSKMDFVGDRMDKKISKRVRDEDEEDTSEDDDSLSSCSLDTAQDEFDAAAHEEEINEAEMKKQKRAKLLAQQTELLAQLAELDA